MNIKMTTYHHECSICHTPFEYGDIKVFRGDDESRFCYYCAAKAAAMFETTSALIGKVTEVENGWEVAFAPDCTTWVTVRRDEHDEPKVGDSITVTVPKVVAIHSQPNSMKRKTNNKQTNT
jgi:CRISPR/Cas system-associated protein Cas10 (large subunit of type III CRISPR-Cas system)